MLGQLGAYIILYIYVLDYFKLSLLNFLGDEIIDYIMLLVTTKKSSSELAKSIDFVMESNTTVFVKWLSTIIKKLQQVTVSTTNQIVSGNLNNFEFITFRLNFTV